MARNRTNTHSVTDPITLADLRWLVEQTKDQPDNCRVTVEASKRYDQRDFDPAKITVHGS